jgi:hypothetical protein
MVLTILDFDSRDIPIATLSLPLGLTQGTEIFLTSIFLTISSTNNFLVFDATVGWETQFFGQNITPELTYKIRRGGTGTNGQIVYETTDGAFLGTGNPTPIPPLDYTTSLTHSEVPDPSIVGTNQQYYLTVTLTGSGNATITGPITFIGQVLG